jgi:hypothetical protein
MVTISLPVYRRSVWFSPGLFVQAGAFLFGLKTARYSPWPYQNQRVITGRHGEQAYLSKSFVSVPGLKASARFAGTLTGRPVCKFRQVRAALVAG